MRAGVVLVLGLAAALLASGCSRSSFEPPEMQGPAAMVEAGGQQRLWLLTKQEERHMVSVGAGRRSAGTWRTDTYFHFAVEAIDPATTKTLWKQRLVTFGDPKASGPNPSRIIGGSESGNLLGKEGDIVWLLIADKPYAVSAIDGRLLADSKGIYKANPALQGLLPNDARHYSFDNGLVFMSADARQFVVRGPRHEALPYEPPPPPVVETRRKPNGMPIIEPMRPPLGEVPARQAQLGGEWLGLYSPKEAEDVIDDDRALEYPYSVLDEGGLARRNFLRAKFVDVKRWDDEPAIRTVSALAPVPDAPMFLKGRFFKAPGRGDEALRLEDPAGLLVWHATRMDDDGRLALARVDENLKVLWQSELPLSETDAVRRVATWLLPGRLLVVGELRWKDDGGVHRREPYLASVDLANGAVTARQLAGKE